MSFVSAAPQLLEAAAQDLAGIRSALSTATAAAAAPTTNLVAAGADEVSAAISQLFGAHGQEFQALHAQAAAFHEEFVSLLNAGAGAYASAEAAGTQTLLSAAVAPVEAFLGQPLLGGGAALTGQIQASVQALTGGISGVPGVSSLLSALETTGGDALTGGLPALINNANAFGATVAAPYQALVANTVNNLQAIGNTFGANPFPFLHQLVNNQILYGQTIANAIGTGITNLPAELANLPATVQAGVQQLLSFNPAPLVQQFITNQVGYAQTIATGLQSAAQDLGNGLLGLPSAFQTAGNALIAGDFQGAVNAVSQGVQNVFLPGFQQLSIDISELGSPTAVPLAITPLGPLGDLAPILAIPGQMAQNFTNLLPAGSIPALMAQNFTNVLTTVTDFGATFNPGNLGVTFGLPLQVLFDGIGAPINALSAANSSATALASAVQTGDLAGAAAAFLTAPANVANGFLNGQTLIDLPALTINVTAGGFPVTALTSTAELPLGGLLTPLSPINLGGGLGPVPGTQIGGIIPGFLSFGSQLAQAIALPPAILPQFVF
ncbi:PE family protein [Mycobacterium kubicae]|uniref:PE family protein n=1 Tax=Mycobacterium kubicae TaxID=120959 RepID=UPI00163F9526|nr:PE family protein [Mycobacterium kubicae]QNI06890.1 PE family protein [Mycobacterium kubicae]